MVRAAARHHTAHLGLLAERDDVWRDPQLLVGPSVSGHAATGLHLIEDEQEPVLIAKVAQRAQEARCRDAYAALAGEKYAPFLAKSGFLSMEAAFRPAYGTHRRAELVLMQKVLDHGRLAQLFTTEIPSERRGPGTWVHDALDVWDRWESRLLRTAAWSPWQWGLAMLVEHGKFTPPRTEGRMSPF